MSGAPSLLMLFPSEFESCLCPRESFGISLVWTRRLPPLNDELQPSFHPPESSLFLHFPEHKRVNTVADEAGHPEKYPKWRHEVLMSFPPKIPLPAITP